MSLPSLFLYNDDAGEQSRIRGQSISEGHRCKSRSIPYVFLVAHMCRGSAMEVGTGFRDEKLLRSASHTCATKNTSEIDLNLYRQPSAILWPPQICFRAYQRRRPKMCSE